MGRIKKKRERTAENYLAEKILIMRGINKEGLKTAMQQAWRTVNEVKIESMGENTFLFKFASEGEKKRVLKGGPWHFDKALIVMTKPAGLGEVTKKNFTHVSFWVQILNVPIMCMNTEMLRELGESIRRVEEVATDVTGACFGKYI